MEDFQEERAGAGKKLYLKGKKKTRIAMPAEGQV